MDTPKERILLVESDPELSDLICRQTLQPLGYRVEVVGAAAPAIQEAVRFAPDVIIANLNLPDLSGKDLLVALSSQGLEVPIIVIAEKGMEGDVIQAFRLGAADFLSFPVREAEVVSAAERVLKQVRARREREMLARQLKQTNTELQRRVRELTTIFSIGKAVTSITDQRALFDKIVEGAVYITEADLGWLFVRDDRSKSFILSAQRNLPDNIAMRINQPWDDGLSSLVALSGETLSIHGEPLKRFKIARLGQSAMVVPVKVKKEVVGLLVMVRKTPQPFSVSNQALLEAVTDYASISLVNARLFRALEERARSLQQSIEIAQISERIKDEILQKASRELRNPLMVAKGNVDILVGNEIGELQPEQKHTLNVVHQRMAEVTEVIEAMSTALQAEATKAWSTANLNELVRQAISRLQSVARQGDVTLYAELSSKPVLVYASSFQLSQVITGLLSNAIRFSPAGGQVSLRLEGTLDNQAHLMIRDNGMGIERKRLEKLFEPSGVVDGVPGSRFGGLGIGLPLVKDILNSHGGKIWAESKPGEGSAFHLTLPLYRE